jgi:eukaryotic-like serine/threonine-protein kinase
VNVSASTALGDDPVMLPLGPGDPPQIGKFQIVGLLGAGGMGEVYLGSADGQYAAIKQIRPQLVSPERFKREITIMHQVPYGIGPQLLAHDTTAARPWFATEYIPGITLEEAVQGNGPLPRGALWLLLARTAAHLLEIHQPRIGIVHRDLKPANVMLVSDNVRLIDFGIARDGTRERLTGYGVSFGTPGYKAPEQRRGGGPVGTPADMYALGVMLVYAASGSDSGPDTEPLRRADPALAALAERCLLGENDVRARPSAAELVKAARNRELAGHEGWCWPQQVMSRIAAREEFRQATADRGNDGPAQKRAQAGPWSALRQTNHSAFGHACGRGHGRNRIRGGDRDGIRSRGRPGFRV